MAEHARGLNISPAVPSLQKAIATGAIGFCLVSLFVFATVAFGERWMYRTLTVVGAYLAWTVLFILLSGGVFGTLVVGRWRLPRFFLLWALAFFLYAAAWVIAYFYFRNTTGELLGSLVGSVLIALVFAAAFRSLGSTVKLSAVLFVSNALGYFLGGALYYSIGGPFGMLLWGLLYGVCFGAGIGAALQFVQQEQTSAGAR
jgi:hypothetical protein